MGQVPPKGFLPSAPYGASPAATALNPVQPAAVNPQVPLLPPNFQDPGTMASNAAANPMAAQGGGAMGGGAFRVGNPILKGLFGAFLFLLLAPLVLATTTVTGTLQNLGTGTVGSAAFVRFWLRGCGGNIPRINGTSVIAPSQGGVYYFDMVANGSGVISGTLYSTRDSTGVLAGEIECGGSKLSVWYGMQIFVGGKGGAEVPIHAKNGVTLDITNVTPITITPQPPAPATLDGIYARLDGANQPFTGRVTAKRFTNNGTPLVAGDFAISGGWGSTAFIDNIVATDSGGEFAIHCQGSGIASTPSITLTYHDGNWGSTFPILVAIRGDNNAPSTAYWVPASNGATGVFQFNGLPVSGTAYTVIFSVIGIKP